MTVIGATRSISRIPPKRSRVSEIELRLVFPAVTYYDGQGFLVRRARNATSALELDNVKSGPSIWGDEQIRRKLRDISVEALRKSGLLERLMMQPNDTSPRASDDELSAHIDDAETDSLLSIASELL